MTRRGAILPWAGIGSTSWMRPRNSALTTISDSTPPIARSSSSAAPDRRWPVATGMARASTFSSAATAETRLIFTAVLKVNDRCSVLSQVLRHQLEDVGHAQVQAPLPGGRRDVHQAAWIVRSHHRAPGLGDGVELPLRKPVRDSRPFEAERPAETAAVGDVWNVDDLIARQLEDLPRLALQSELTQRLAGVVVCDLQAHPVVVDKAGVGLQELQDKARRVAHAAAQVFVRGGSPVGGVDGESAEARGG